MSDSIKTFKTGYILLPVLIGLSVVGWLFYREFNPELFSGIRFSWRLVGGLLLAVLFMFGRDGGLMWRFRFITDRELTWRQAFRVNMLCEFTSAVTPSAVGGSSLIVLFLNKEGINAGRSTALTISCLFLDELFLVLALCQRRSSGKRKIVSNKRFTHSGRRNNARSNRKVQIVTTP